MDDFNLENASKFLDKLKESEPEALPRGSMRQTIISLAPKIRELMDLGWTQRQILEMLKKEYGIKLEYGSFRNYLNQAGKKADQ